MDFEIPESLEGLTLAELNDLADKARAAGREIGAKADDEITADEVAKGADLIKFLSEVDTAVEAAEKADADRADTLASLRGLAEAEKEDAPAAEAEDKTDEADAGDKPEADADVEAEAQADTEKEPVVAASPRKSAASLAADGASKAEVEAEKVERPKATIVASASVRQWASGDKITDIDEMAAYAVERMKDLPTGGRQRVKQPVFQITKGRNDGLVAGASAKDDLQEILNRVHEESQVGGALTAAAGWCAPSETVYDIAPHLATTEGLWKVPEVNVKRGGLRFTKGPHFADFFAMTNFDLTETEVEAHDPDVDGPLKDMFVVPCPSFQDVRLEAIGYGVVAGVLQNAGYPEVIQNYLSGGLIGHAHRRDTKLLQQALTIAGAATTVANPWTNATAILTALELVVLGERQRYRLGLSQTLEVVLPVWIKGAIRADLAQRTGVDLINVADPQIEAYFRTRGANVQFVYNWQSLTLSSAGAGPAIDYPATVEALIYPSGTYTVLSDDVLSVSQVYDYDQLRNNEYLAFFFEEGVALANTRHTPKRISVALNVTGNTGAANVSRDWGSATALTTP